MLTMTADAVALAQFLVSDGAVPQEATVDALHVALAAVNGVDYLLTWNCRHLANATLRVRFEAVLNTAGHACPIICTPEELMED